MPETDRERRIVPLHAARVEDLAHADKITAECLKCGHRSTVTVDALRRPLPNTYHVTDIWRVLRCEDCGAKGQVLVDARTALGHDRI